MTLEMTAARIAENQSRFRRANEQIELAADGQQLAGPIPFLCECSRADCMRIVELTLAEYELVREKPERFFTALEHQSAGAEGESEALVAQHDTYVIVDKLGIAGDIAALRYSELQVRIAPQAREDRGSRPR